MNEMNPSLLPVISLMRMQYIQDIRQNKLVRYVIDLLPLFTLSTSRYKPMEFVRVRNGC